MTNHRSHSSGGQESTAGLMGLKSRSQQGYVLSGGSRRECASLTSPVSRGHTHSFTQAPSPSSSQQHTTFLSLQLWEALSCIFQVCLWLHCTHLDNPGSPSHRKTIHLIPSAKSLFPWNITYSTGLGISVGNRYSAHPTLHAVSSETIQISYYLMLLH